MKTLPVDASDEDILEAVYAWIGLLAEERYEPAYHFFVDSEHNPWHWSPQLLKRVIRTHGGYHKQETDTVTAVEKTTGGLEPRHDVHRDDDNAHQGYIWFD